MKKNKVKKMFEWMIVYKYINWSFLLWNSLVTTLIIMIIRRLLRFIGITLDTFEEQDELTR